MSYSTTGRVTAMVTCREPVIPPYPGPAPGTREPPAGPHPESLPRRREGRSHPVPVPVVDRCLREADGLALSLRSATARIAVVLGRAAAAFHDARGWTALGYARLDDHARERLGRTGRWLRDMGRLGRAIDRLPALGRALLGADDGRPVGIVAVLLLDRVAEPCTVEAWIKRARGLSVRALRQAVREELAGRADTPPGGAASEATGFETGDEDDRAQVTVLGPRQLRAAFEETLELYRAVEGHDVTATSFVEALVAEASTAGCPPDAEARPLRHGVPREVIEGALERSTDGWAHLPPTAGASWALAMVRVALERLEDLEAVAGKGGPAAVETQIRSALRLQDELDRRLAALLRDMGRRGAWSRLRFADVGHYAAERLGMSRTAADDRLRLERALDGLPRLRAAYADGRVSFEAARCVTRILRRARGDAAVEEAWIRRAGESTVKRLRDEERALSRECPADPTPLEDAAWHASLRRAPGTGRRRILRLALEAAQERHPDVFLRVRLPGRLAADLLSAVESARSALTARVEAIPWDLPWPDPAPLGSVVAARTFSVRGRRVPAWVGLLALLEEFALTWDPVRRRRSSLRVHERDGWRCMAPGCTSRRNLESHHVVYESHGGGDELENRVSLCRFHHQRGEHGDLLRCRGKAPLGLLWRLGRPEVAESFRNERRVPSG